MAEPRGPWEAIAERLRRGLRAAIASLLRPLTARMGRRLVRNPGGEVRQASAPADLQRLRVLPEILQQGQTNACGPYSLAMAASCVWPGRHSPAEIGRRVRLFRVPWLGATLPWGIASAGRSLGLDVRARWLGRIEDLKRCVDVGHPAIVLVHPDERAGCAWYALHYRVLVGYRDDPSLPGGGEFYFACSATRCRALGGGRPGNLALDYAQFRRQWATYLTPNWYAEVTRA